MSALEMQDEERSMFRSLSIRVLAPHRRSRRILIQPADSGLQEMPFAAFARLGSDGADLPTPLVQFWRDVDRFVEQELRSRDFHCDIDPQGSGFVLSVLFSSSVTRAPPKPRLACISCDIGNPIAQACLIHETAWHRCWIDAKARCYYIVTPIAHVETFRDLSDTQLSTLWTDALDLLDLEVPRALGISSPGSQLFDRLTINFGCYRNLAHLHLKVKVSSSLFARIVAHWDPSRQARRQESLRLATNPHNMAAFIGGSFRPPPF